MHIDDMLELKEGEYAKAVKTVPSDADYLEYHYPGYPIAPHSLLIESMAQAAGILIGKSIAFKRDVILAKIDSADFFSITRPGDRLVIEARAEEMREEGAIMECRISCGDRDVARSRLVFAILDEKGAAMLGADNFVFSGELLSRFGLFGNDV
jgi:3-hydroxyacyl-[acyl-carrier-protein] dehydratase